MEDCREKNFREIQKLLDGCIAYGYDKIIRALTLKCEYFTKEQVKEYLRQEIFRVTDSLVAMQQKYRALRNVRMDMYIPDFLWESAFFEDLTPVERKKYINFSCQSFDMGKYLRKPVCYDEQLPYFSVIIDFVVSTKYLEYLQEDEKAFYPVETTEEFIIQPKEEVQTEEKPKKIVGKSNPFQSKLKSAELKLLAECLNESRMFTTTVSPKILTDFFNCKLNGVLKVNNTRLFAYLMMQLSCYNYIAYEWQSVVAHNKLVLGKLKGEPLTRTDLSSATDQAKSIYPKGYEIIDKYIKQLKKG